MGVLKDKPGYSFEVAISYVEPDGETRVSDVVARSLGYETGLARDEAANLLLDVIQEAFLNFSRGTVGQSGKGKG